MSDQPEKRLVLDLSGAVRALLDSPPEGMSDAALATLAQAMQMVDAGLPTHLYHAAVEQSQVAISITDTDANILYVNPAFTRVTGYSGADIVGQNESLLSDRTTPVAVYKELWGALLRQQPWNGVLVNRRKNGTRYLAELIVAPVIDGEGRTTHYLGMHRDVTAMHRLEQDVRNKKRLIESAVNVTPLPIVLLDSDQNVVLDNLAYKTLRSDMEGEEPAQVFIRKLESVLGKGNYGDSRAFEDVEVDWDPGGGKPVRWFACSGTWFRECDSEVDTFFNKRSSDYLLLAAKEITELRRRQEEVRWSAMRALIAEEERAQTMRETIAAAIYQLKGPFNLLNAIKGMAERRHGDGNEFMNTLWSVLTQVSVSGQEALATLEAALPRESREPLVAVNLNVIIRDVLAISTERLIAAGILVDWRPAPKIPTLMGYENRLRGMLKQLLDNSIDAMSGRAVRERELTIATGVDGDHVSIAIEDTGPGIDEDLRLKVFEPFFTTKGATGHAGMGLVLVQEVINQHSGTVSIDSGEKGGCRMSLTIPLASPGQRDVRQALRR